MCFNVKCRIGRIECIGSLSVRTGHLNHVFPCLSLRLLLVVSSKECRFRCRACVLLKCSFVSLLSHFCTLFAILSISFPLPVHFHKGSRSHVYFCPRLCSITYRWAEDTPPTDAEDKTLCVARALMPLLGLVATACMSSPRDWAVSVGSHMQQDVEMSLAPPHPVAPFHAA